MRNEYLHNARLIEELIEVIHSLFKHYEEN